MNGEWKAQIPLAYGLGPDVILGVHRRWRAGTMEEEVTREFSVFHINRVKPFFTPDPRIILELMKDWRVPAEDIEVLRELASLRGLEEEFWTALAGLRFRLSVDAQRGGHVWGTAPVMVSEKARVNLGHLADDPPIALMRAHGAAAVIELISAGIVSVLDFSVAYSRQVIGHGRSSGARMYFRNERAIHPLAGFLGSQAEFIGGALHPLSDDSAAIYLWVGPHDHRRSELEQFAQQIRERSGVHVTVMGIL